MDTNNKEQMHGNTCGAGCGNCGKWNGCHHGGIHHLIKKILMLVIVAMIFGMGLRLGMIIGVAKGGANYHRGGAMMMDGGKWEGKGMMMGGYAQPTAPVAK